MQSGDRYPVARWEEDGSSYEIAPFNIIKMHNRRLLKTRKKTNCFCCGGSIGRGEDCYFADTIMVHPDHCPILFVNMWWHNACDTATYADILLAVEHAANHMQRIKGGGIADDQ